MVVHNAHLADCFKERATGFGEKLKRNFAGASLMSPEWIESQWFFETCN